MKNYVIGLLLISSCSIHSMFGDTTHTLFDLYQTYEDHEQSQRQRTADPRTKCKVRCYSNENNVSEWRLIVNDKLIYTILNPNRLRLENDMDAYIWIDQVYPRFSTRIITHYGAAIAILQQLHESKTEGITSPPA